MEAVCRGAKSAGGTTVGILPRLDPTEANQFVDISIPTGMGEARNALVVSASRAVVAVGGEYGTLAEIALALRVGKPVVGVDTWKLEKPDGSADSGIVRVDDPAAAAELAVSLAES